MENDNKLAKRLVIWAAVLAALLTILWGYKQGWWGGNYTSISEEQRQRTEKLINDTISDIAYWGYRIYLVDTKDGEIKGEAAFRFMNDKYEHMVVAELPDPAKDYYYEVWLERISPPGQLNMGKMFKRADGRYTLEFNSSRNYSDFPRLTVTLELSDNNLEKSDQEIIKGSFK